MMDESNSPTRASDKDMGKTEVLNDVFASVFNWSGLLPYLGPSQAPVLLTESEGAKC